MALSSGAIHRRTAQRIAPAPTTIAATAPSTGAGGMTSEKRRLVTPTPTTSAPPQAMDSTSARRRGLSGIATRVSTQMPKRKRAMAAADLACAKEVPDASRARA